MPIEIEGMAELKKTLHDMEEAINPKIELMTEFTRIMMADIDKTFVLNGRGLWAAQAPSTRPGKGGTLEFTGALRSSMEPRLGKNYAEVKPSNSVYRYGAVNHYGSKSGRIPRRPFMYISKEAQEELMTKYANKVEQAMK